MCHLVDDTIDGLCHSGHCYHQDWFKGWYQCWMPMEWSWLDLQRAAGHRIQSLERIPLSLFVDNARKVVVCQDHPLFQGILPYNRQWQTHYHFLSDQLEKHCHCNWGESLSKTHFICHLCSWHISIPNASSHDEQDGPNLVHQTLSCGPAWNWTLAGWNTVICWMANRMCIQLPDCFIKTLVCKLVIDWIKNGI